MGQLGGGDPARSSAAAAGSVSVVAAVSASGAAFEATGGGVGDLTLSGVTELTSIHSGTAGKAWPDMIRQADGFWEVLKGRYDTMTQGYQQWCFTTHSEKCELRLSAHLVPQINYTGTWSDISGTSGTLVDTCTWLDKDFRRILMDPWKFGVMTESETDY